MAGGWKRCVAETQATFSVVHLDENYVPAGWSEQLRLDLDQPAVAPVELTAAATDSSKPEHTETLDDLFAFMNDIMPGSIQVSVPVKVDEQDMIRTSTDETRPVDVSICVHFIMNCVRRNHRMQHLRYARCASPTRPQFS
jgi:hypothetical protein